MDCDTKSLFLCAFKHTNFKTTDKNIFSMRREVLNCACLLHFTKQLGTRESTQTPDVYIMCYASWDRPNRCLIRKRIHTQSPRQIIAIILKKCKKNSWKVSVHTQEKYDAKSIFKFYFFYVYVNATYVLPLYEHWLGLFIIFHLTFTVYLVLLNLMLPNIKFLNRMHC